jgi:hypothetical protein
MPENPPDFQYLGVSDAFSSSMLFSGVAPSAQHVAAFGQVYTFATSASDTSATASALLCALTDAAHSALDRVVVYAAARNSQGPAGAVVRLGGLNITQLCHGAEAAGTCQEEEFLRHLRPRLRLEGDKGFLVGRPLQTSGSEDSGPFVSIAQVR